jgi:hypothetical protein
MNVRAKIATRLVCSKCGARGEMNCACGVDYIRAGEFAATAVADPANAAKSNRALAAELGVDEKTVRQARSGAEKSAPDKRVGRDGKRYSRPKIDRARAAADVIAARGETPTRTNVMAESGVTELPAQLAVEAFRAVREAKAEIDEEALAKAAIEALPESSRDKLDIALKRETKRLEAEFETRVRAEVQKRLAEMVLPHYNEKLRHYEAVCAAYRGVLTKIQYNLILACLHPDNVASPERRQEAFVLFRGAEIKLVDETESPMMGARPWSLDGLDRRKR